MRRHLLLPLILLVSPALAEETDPPATIIDGIYMNDSDLCARAKAEGVEAVAADGNLVLHSGKIESVEYHCDFVDVKQAGENALVVTAFCEEPGYAFPDLLTIMKREEGRLEITSVRDQPELPSGNSGSWTKCDGVTMP